jgi:hypothetical protein
MICASTKGQHHTSSYLAAAGEDNHIKLFELRETKPDVPLPAKSTLHNFCMP